MVRAMTTHTNRRKPAHTAPADPVGDDLLTTAEVAQLLRVDPSTVRRYIDAGQLAGIRLPGRGVRVERAELGRMLDRHRTSTPLTLGRDQVTRA